MAVENSAAAESNKASHFLLADFFPESPPISERQVFRTLRAPVTVQWELTPWCNESCIHCYNFWRDAEEKEQPLLFPGIKETFEISSSEIVSNHVFQVTVTGGEPLAVFKQAYPYLKRLSNNGISLSLNSNLTMLTRERALLLKELGVRSILTSLMSGSAELNDELANRPGTHKDVSKGIKIALEEGLWVGVNMVVTRKNLPEIYSTADYVRSLGVTAFSATKASTPINSTDFSDYALSGEEFGFMLNELLRVREELSLNVDSLEFYPMCFFDTQETRDLFGNRICNAGKTACTIGFNGQVRPCSHAVQTYGSVKKGEGGLKQAWDNLQPWRTDALIPAECGDCSLKNMCRGGCRTEAYALSGSLKAPDPYCNFVHPPLPRSSKIEDSVISVDGAFSFHPAIKAREEDFGGILFVTPVRWIPVNKKLY